MKSVKYSAVSKMKKQKQQEKVQSSFLHILKQDDQICTGLLDTLSDDYLGYLEELMGKKSGRQTKISQDKHKNIPNSYQKDPIIDLNVKINDKLSVDNSPTKQQISIEQESPQIISSIVFLQPKKDQPQITQQPQRAKKALKVNQLDENQVKNHTKFNINNQKNNLQVFTQLPIKNRNDSKNKSEGKILIKNIQGYLESLSKIKHKPSIESYIQQSQHQKNSIKPNKSIEKSQSVQLKNKKQKQNSYKSIEKLLKNQKKFNFIQQSEKFDQKQRKNHSENKFSKNKQKIQQIKYFNQRKLLDEKTDSDSYPDEYQSNINDQSQISMDSYNNSTIPVQRNRIFFAQSKRNQKSKQKRYDDQQILQKNKLKNDIFKGFQANQKDTSLQLLLIKVIAKYNKLLHKHNKSKFHIQQLQKQLFKCKQENQQKNAEIQRLNFINNQLLNTDKSFSKNKNNKKSHKTSQIDDNKFLQQYGKTFFYRNGQKEIQQNLNKLDFRRKNKGHDGKAINIEKMFIIDNFELHKRKQKDIDQNLLIYQPNNFRYDKTFDFSHQDRDKENEIKRQKRSISCRQASTKYKYIEQQPSYGKIPFHDDRKQKQHYMKNIEKEVDFPNKFNTLSYDKVIKYKQPLKEDNLRLRAFSETHHSLPIKTQKTSKEKHSDRFPKNPISRKSQTSGTNKKNNYSNKTSSSQQFCENIKQKTYHNENNNSRQQLSSGNFMKKILQMNNQESQQTDSELLQKLLTIQNTYRGQKTAKNQGSKMFFK